MKKINLIITAIVFCVLINPSSTAIARRGGGGFRSSPRSHRSSPPKIHRTTKPSNKKAIRSKRTKTSTKKITKRKTRKADKALAAKAKKSGNYHKDRKSARAAFKKKNTGKYKSKYKTKPKTRPAHIPQTTSVGGNNYNVTFNSRYGGYGYMGSSGWVAYNAMADIAMMSVLMNRQGYYIESDRPVIVRNDDCFIQTFIW